MSYEIIYEKYAVKLNEDEFIMFGVWGSNNCWDYNGKRERVYSIIPFNINKENYKLINKNTFEKEFKEYQKEKFEESKKEDISNDEKGQSVWNNNYKSLNDITYSWYTSIYLQGRKTITIQGAITIIKNVIKESFDFNDLYKNGVKFFYINENKENKYIETVEELSDIIKNTNYHVRCSNTPTEKLKRINKFNKLNKEYGEVYAIKGTSIFWNSYLDKTISTKRGTSFRYIEKLPFLMFGTKKAAEAKLLRLSKIRTKVLEEHEVIKIEKLDF